MTVEELRAEEYEQRRDTALLRQRAHTVGTSAKLLAELATAEEALARAEQARAAAETGEGPDEQATLGLDSTELEATYTLRMAQLPTSIYHLFDVAQDPLVTGSILNRANETRRLRVTAFLDGYSATAVDTLEIKSGRTEPFRLLPTLFPDRLRDLVELTRGTLNVLIEDLGKTGVEVHRTTPVWILPRTTAPLAVRDPETGGYHDLTRYLGAYVTPNDPAIMRFLRTIANHHPSGQLIGYQGKKAEDVTSQIRAIFEALKAEAGIRYVNSVISFSPEDATSTQRVRLPAESLRDQEANCIDGTVLVASLIEAASMNAALVIVPGHAFVGWETGKASNTWGYLETTIIGTDGFDAACERAQQLASTYETLATSLADPNRFRRWSIRELRGLRITPLQ